MPVVLRSTSMYRTHWSLTADVAMTASPSTCRRSVISADTISTFPADQKVACELTISPRAAIEIDGRNGIVEVVGVGRDHLAQGCADEVQIKAYGEGDPAKVTIWDRGIPTTENPRLRCFLDDHVILAVDTGDFAGSVDQHAGIAPCAVFYLSGGRIDNIAVVLACGLCKEPLYPVLAHSIVLDAFIKGKTGGSVTGFRNDDRIRLVGKTWANRARQCEIIAAATAWGSLSTGTESGRGPIAAIFTHLPAFSSARS